VEDLVEQVSEAQLRADVEALAGLGTRYTLADSFPEVTSYLLDTLIERGFSPEVDLFQVYGREVANVVVVLPGEEEPWREVIVCAHYDSTSDDPLFLAPGADDNASGSAAVLQVAEVLREARLQATVRCIWFAGEEQGLYGSRHYAAEAAGEGAEITAVVNIDMVGYAPGAADWGLIVETDSFALPLADSVAAAVIRYTSLPANVAVPAWGSDHVPFLDEGYPAVLAIERSWDENPYYHRTTDQPGTLNWPFLAEVTRGVLAAAVEQAGLVVPPPPAQLPSIALWLDAQAYSPGDRLELRAGMRNPGPAVDVDRYVALEAYGTYYFHPDWGRTPVAERFRLEEGGERTETLLDIVLPEDLQPGGPFTFWAGLTRPESGDLIGELARVDFVFLDRPLYSHPPALGSGVALR
jgi:hypothetical protein